MKNQDKINYDVVMKSDFKKKINVFFRKLRAANFVAVQRANELMLQDEKVNYGMRHAAPCGGVIWYTDWKDMLNCMCRLLYETETMTDEELVSTVSKIADENGLKAEKINNQIIVCEKIA